MADAMAAGPFSHLISPNRQPPANGRGGPCDPMRSNDINKLLAWRYDRQYLPFDVGGGNLVLAAGRNISFFAAGAPDNNLDYTQSNALAEGALAKNDEAFEVVGFGFHFGEPVVLTGTTDAKYAAWISGPDGVYTERLKKASMENTAGILSFADDPSPYLIGLLSLLPGHSPIMSASANGSPYVGGMGFYSLPPLNMSVMTYGRRDSGKMTVQVNGPTKKTTTVDAGSVLIPGGVTQVSVPITCIAYGFRNPDAARDCVVACETPAGMDQLVAAVAARLGR